jgi:hypothetical protein
MKIIKLGENSLTGYNGVNDIHMIIKLTKEEINSIYDNVTPEIYNKLGIDKEIKKLETIEIFKEL